MTDPAPSPPAGQRPAPHRPMPRLGGGIVWADVLAKIEADQAERQADFKEPAEDLNPGGDDSRKLTSAPGHRNGCQGCEHDPATIPLCWSEEDTDAWFALLQSGIARDVPPAPPAAELRAMADDLNSHGGLDETFVAALLKAAADPLADAKRGLGIVDTPPPVTTTEPIAYETIVEALEKIAPLGPQRLNVVKLTQEQIDAVTASQPHAAPSAEPWHFFGTSVELVETVEESTPYQLVHAQPGGIIEFHGNLTEPEFERLREDWLRAVDAKPVLPRWLVDADREFVAHVNDGVDRAAVLAAVQAEARRPAARPWWRRALDRVRGWGQ